jgi:hypothetical protein
MSWDEVFDDDYLYFYETRSTTPAAIATST